jgi:tetratricopeptide (TPR) repeat protein
VAESLEREIEGLRSLFRSERDPEGRAFVPLADAYRRNRDLDRALQLLAEGLERHPDFASAHVVSAWIHRDRGDPDNARLAWARVLDLDDENVEALKGLGTLLLESGRPQEARPYLERARSLDPEAGSAPAVGFEAPRAAEPPAADVWAGAAVDELEEDFLEVSRSDLLAQPDRRHQPVTADELPDDDAPESPAVAELLAGAVVDEPLEEAPAEVPAGRSAFQPWTGGLERVEESIPGQEIEAPDEPVVARGLGGTTETSGAPPETEEIAEARSAREEDHETLEVEEPPALPETRTMAELFARQGLHARAVGIYERLVDASPDDEVLIARLDELREASRPQREPSAGVHDEDTEAIAIAEGWWSVEHEPGVSLFGWTPDEPSVEDMDKGEEPVSSYFRRLLAWEPGAEADDPAAALAEPEIVDHAAEDPSAVAVATLEAPGMPAVGEVGEAEGEEEAPFGVEAAGAAQGSAATEEPALEDPWLAPPALPSAVDEAPERAVVPIEALAPDEPAYGGASEPIDVVPIASLAPDAVPIESLAPDAEPSAGGSPIRF